MLCLVAQSCPTLCSPMDCLLPDSSVHGILQTRILEWVAMPSSRGSSQSRNQTGVSCIAGRFFTSWATREAPSTTGGFCALLLLLLGFPGSSISKESATQCRRPEFNPWVRKIPWRKKDGSPLLYSCLENPKDRGYPGGHNLATKPPLLLLLLIKHKGHY